MMAFLVPIGFIGQQSVVITTNLFAEGYEDEQKRKDLVNRGLELLRQPDPEDTEYMKLRVIEKDKNLGYLERGRIYLYETFGLLANIAERKDLWISEVTLFARFRKRMVISGP